MGRPSKLTDAQWEDIRHHDWRALALAFVSSKSDESCVSLLVRLACIFGTARSLFRCAPIDRYRFEFRIDRFAADLVLFHSDGGVTVVELKGDTSVRTIVAGIGQLCLYADLYRKRYRCKYVDRLLVAPAESDDVSLISDACCVAGVAFCKFPDYSLVRKYQNECILKWCESGT